MKKMLVFLVMLISLVGNAITLKKENYKVEIKQGIKINSKKLNESNKEIEKVIEDMVSQSYKIYDEIEEEMKTDDVDISEKEVSILKNAFEYNKKLLQKSMLQLDEIEYRNENLAFVKLTYKVPKVKKLIEEEQISVFIMNILSMGSENTKDLEKFQNEIEKFYSEGIENLNSITEYEEEKLIIQVEKINNKWEMIM